MLNFAAQKGGLTEGDRRLWYKALDKIQAAVKENKEAVNLEDDEFGFLRKVKAAVMLAPSLLNRKVEALIEDVEYR